MSNHHINEDNENIDQDEKLNQQISEALEPVNEAAKKKFDDTIKDANIKWKKDTYKESDVMLGKIGFYWYTIAFGIKFDVRINQETNQAYITRSNAKFKDYAKAAFKGKVHKNITFKKTEAFIKAWCDGRANIFENFNSQVFAQTLVSYVTQGDHNGMEKIMYGTYALSDKPGAFARGGVAAAHLGEKAVGNEYVGAGVKGPSVLAKAVKAQDEKGLMVDANIGEIKASVLGVQVKGSLGVKTGVGVKDKTLELKILGCGIKIGKTMGVAVLGSEAEATCLIM